MIGRLAVIIAGLLVALPAAAQQGPRPLFETPDLPAARSTAPTVTVKPLDEPATPAAAASARGEPAGSQWAGTSAIEMAELLRRLEAVSADPALHRLILEIAQYPSPPGALVAERADLLIAIGEIDVARRVLMGSGSIVPALESTVAILDLAARQDADACQAVQRAGDATVATSELKIVCALRAGDPDTAQVLGDALRETEGLRPQPFGALLDVARELGKAEQVDWSARVEVTDLALATALFVPVPALAAEHASPPALERLSVSDDLSPDVRATARARLEALRGGHVTTGSVASALRTIADPVERAHAIVTAWQGIRSPVERSAVLGQLAPVTAMIPPQTALADDAPVLATILLGAGEEGAALAWFDMLESMGGAALRPTADRLAVLMVLAGLVDASRMPAQPAELFTMADARWLVAGLDGQGVPLAGPWRSVLPPLADIGGSGTSRAARLANAVLDVASDDPAMVSRGLKRLVALDRAIDARAIAVRTAATRLG